MSQSQISVRLDETWNKPDVSRTGLVSALRNTPHWSKMRWINVDGIEKDAFYAIFDEYKLNLNAVSRMFQEKPNFDADMYGDQLFCQLPVLKKVDDGPDAFTLNSFLNAYNIFQYDSKISTHEENGWLFMPNSKTVISFFEGSGEEVEELVFYDFLRNLRSYKEMNTDASVLFENILSAFVYRFPSIGSLIVSDIQDNIKGSHLSKLQDLHSLTYTLAGIKTRVNSLIQMINVLMELPPISDSCKLHLLSFNKFLKQQNILCEERIIWNKTQIESNALLTSEDSNKYMFTLATVSTWVPHTSLGSLIRFIRLLIVRHFSVRDTDTTSAELHRRSANPICPSIFGGSFDEQSTCSSTLSSQADPAVDILNRPSRTSVVNEKSAETNMNTSVNKPSDDNFSVPEDPSETTNRPIISSNSTTITGLYKTAAQDAVPATNQNDSVNWFDAISFSISTKSLRDVASIRNAGQSKDNPVQDTYVPGTSQTKTSTAAETPLSVPIEDRSSHKSEASSNRNAAFVNADPTVTSNCIPDQFRDSQETSVPGTSQTEKSNAAETPLSVPIEGRSFNTSDVSGDGNTAFANEDSIFTSNRIASQSKDNPVKDKFVLRMNETKKSNVVETPLSIPLEDRSIHESVSSSDQVSTKMNADTVGMESSLVNSLMKSVSSIISRKSRDSGVDVRNIDSRSTGGSPGEMV
ncbi:unnamed protein product [Ambrosiozyma monospora]|uniref:Unnamed protein product n=1 Tax=Ambrosiozyma monospora TaxID=43982 RepID=A0ACB5SV31_AMBMO|nr:unnamed protein product [Ambrosiozyma monospora]